MRFMAVITRCNGMMARLLPAVILFVHDVAVCASLRVIGEVECPLRIIKCVAAQANKYADTTTQENSQKVKPDGSFMLALVISLGVAERIQHNPLAHRKGAKNAKKRHG